MWLIVTRTIVDKKFIFGTFGLNLTHMNKIVSISTEYLSPSRTIEILNLVRFNESKQVYIYNYEGNHFRFFDNLISLIQFFESGKEPISSFEREEDLKDFLTAIPINCEFQKLNLKLNYRYRDGANYKQFGSVIFSNPSFLPPRIAGQKLIEKLISTEFFVPQDWDLPRLHHHPYDPEIDHEWHEFEEFEWTDEDVSDKREVKEFLEGIEKGYEI